MEAPTSESQYFREVTRTLQFSEDAAFKFIGVRAFIMSASTIADVIDDFYLVLGERFVDARLYMGGRRAGRRTGAALTAAFKIDPGDKPSLERFFTDFYAALGWGRLDFRLDHATGSGEVFAYNSFLAQGAVAKFTARGAATAVAEVKPVPRCAMLGGYIAGLVSLLLDSEKDVQEVECVTANKPHCRFEVTAERLHVI